MKNNKFKNKVFKISDRKIVKNINKKNKILTLKTQNYLQNKSILNEILGRKKLVNLTGYQLTQTIKKDNLFLAIKGKNNDGNSYF